MLKWLHEIFVNLKIYIRAYLGRYAFVLRVYRLFKGKSDLRITPYKDYCIEGFPRSANTFGVLLIQHCSVRKYTAAHHMHCSAQLTEAIRLRVPAVLLIREPLDAAISLTMKTPGVKLGTALNWYIIFHRQLLSSIEDLVIVSFDEITEPTQVFFDKFSARIPELDIDFSNFDLADLYKKIDASVVKNDPNSAQSMNLVTNRPTKEKEERKDLLMKTVVGTKNSIESKLRLARELYRSFVDKSILNVE